PPRPQGLYLPRRASSVDLPVVGVDDVLFRLFLAPRSLTVRTAGACALVDVLSYLLKRLVELVHGLAEGGSVPTLAGGLERLHLGLDLGLDLSRDALLVLLEHLLGLVDHLVGLVAQLDLLSLTPVLGGVRLGLLYQPLDLVLAQSRGRRDGHRLLAASPFVLCLDVEDAVGVDVERDLNLGHTAWCRRDPVKVEAAQRPVVPSEVALPLDDVDLDRRLVVGRGREDVGTRCRDRRVALDEPREHTTHRLDAQREGSDVQQKNVLDLALEHTGLYGGADGDHLVRVDAFVRLLAPGQLLDQLLDGRHPGGATHQHDLVDLLRRQSGVLQGRHEGRAAALGQVRTQRFELGPGKRHLQVLGAGLVGGDEGQVDRGLQASRELDLGPLGGLRQSLQRLAVSLQVDAVFLFELLGQPVHDPAVVVVAAQVGVAVGRLDLEDAVADVQDRDVEGAAAEVEDPDGLVLLLVQAIGQRRRRRLVDDPEHVEAGDLARVLGRLALRVVEVGRHRDDGVGDLLAQVGFGVRLQLLKDHRRDLLGRELLPRAGHADDHTVVLARLDGVGDDLALGLHLPVGAAHETLDRVDGVFRVDGRLAAGEVAHKALPGLGEGDHRGRGPCAFGIRDDHRLTTLHDRDHGVGGAEVDSNGLWHEFLRRCYVCAYFATPLAFPLAQIAKPAVRCGRKPLRGWCRTVLSHRASKHRPRSG